MSILSEPAALIVRVNEFELVFTMKYCLPGQVLASGKVMETVPANATSIIYKPSVAESVREAAFRIVAGATVPIET